MVVLLHAMDPNKRRKVESSVSMGSYSVTGQHSINGGEESHEERSGEINSPSYAEFKSIVLSRNFLAKYCHVPFFAKLVLGYFIRFQLEPGKYHLFRVDGIEKGPKYYALTLSNGQKKNSRVNLHAFDVCRQPPKAVSLPISGVSNSPPTETEYHQALTTIHETARENFDDLKKMGLTSISPSFLNTKTHVLEKIVKRTWYCPLTRDVLALLKDTQERIIRDQEKGLASHVKAQEQNPVPWGGHNQSKHRCRILFRSWIARPTVPQANLVDVKLPGESGMDEHGNRYGTGMSDEIQKYSGRYCYLFYHSKNDRLQPLECPADLSYDELQPEITAWRAARQILGYIPLKYFKYAIISRIDCVREPQENESFTSRRACISPAATRAGVNQEDVKEDIDKYGRRYVTNTDEEALQHFIVVDPPTPAYRDWASTNRATGSGGRILESAEQLFFVDLDVLLRVEAISPSTIRDNVSRFQSLIPGRTNVWPSQVLWVPEDVLIKTQKGEESQYHGIHICQSLTQAMLCEFSAYQHPFIYPRRNGNKVRLYHGTSPSSAVRILEDGFKKPTCKKTEECKTGNCCCQMEVSIMCFQFRFCGYV